LPPVNWPSANKADTNGAPNVRDGASAFDAALSIDVPGIDFQTQPQPFNAHAACRGLAACMLLAADAKKIPLEYGRVPADGAFNGYFSTPSDWLARKVDYMRPKLEREAEENGFTFKATAEAIATQKAAKVAEYTDYCTAIARDLAQAIKSSVVALKTADRQTLAETVHESFESLGMKPADEIKGAGNALMNAKRERYARGEKTAVPQPGMLALLKAAGCEI
jgi:hypothetical protein